MARRITKAQQEQAKADELRSAAIGLLLLRHNDWNDWESDWLGDEARRRHGYIYSEKEHAVLDRLRTCAKAFTAYGGYTVPELIAIAYPCRFDLDEDGQDFLEKLHRWDATELRLRQLRRLVGICRAFVGLDLPRDIEPPDDDDHS